MSSDSTRSASETEEVPSPRITNGGNALNLKELEERCSQAQDRLIYYADIAYIVQYDVPALIAEVERLREALQGIIDGVESTDGSPGANSIASSVESMATRALTTP